MGDELDTDYAKIRDFVERDKYTINLRTPYHVGLELKIFDQILPYIITRKWILVKASRGQHSGFVTSDHVPDVVRSSKARGFLRPRPWPKGNTNSISHFKHVSNDGCV